MNAVGLVRGIHAREPAALLLRRRLRRGLRLGLAQLFHRLDEAVQAVIGEEKVLVTQIFDVLAEAETGHGGLAAGY